MSILFHNGRVARTVCAALLLTPASLSAGFTRAADSTAERAQHLVQEALHLRVYGDNASSEKLLRQAVDVDPNCDTARWHLGMVFQDGRWVEAEQMNVESAESEALGEYYRIRESFRETVVSQMQAADWCRDRGLRQRERAHLNKVLQIKPEHEPALLRLGYEPVPGGWASFEEIEAAEKAAEARRVALAHWRPRIEHIRDQLNMLSRHRRIQGKEALMAIESAEAIEAVEQVLSRDSQDRALLVLKWLREMTDPRAALSMARHAVYSPWHDVRETASRYLSKRPLDTFVPQMLASMQSRVDARFAATRGRRGIETSLLFVRETQDTFDRQRFAGVQPTARLAVALRYDNARIDMTNDAIARSLNVVTKQDLPSDPQLWWDWWDRYNEDYVEGEKPIRDYSRDVELARIDRIQDFWEQQQQEETRRWIESDIRRRMPQRRKDCLAAGTLVWTSRGTVPIEQMHVGDMVLSQNEQTGQLDYKVVLRTTVRPEEQLVRIHTAQESFQVSGGHPFWVVGSGWVKARSLKSGMTLHTLRGTTQISRLSPGATEKTYNLIVADFNTYFIGKSRTFTHDNTPRTPNALLVPGLRWK